MNSALSRLATILRLRNELDEQIAELIQRPALPGHIGEFIASKVFDIELHSSAAHKGSDGIFRSGPLRSKTVNIKLYGKQDGLLDMRTDAIPDYYLILAGSKSIATTSKGTSRPVTIDAVFMFDGLALRERLTARGSKVGTATSVRKSEWLAAKVWPKAECKLMTLSQEQASSLALFASPSAV